MVIDSQIAKILGVPQEESFPYLSRYLENTAPFMRLAIHYTTDGKECVVELYRVDPITRTAGKIVQVIGNTLTLALQELDDSCRINFKVIERKQPNGNSNSD